MATKMPRLNVVMEPYVYQALLRIASKQGLSLSLVARDLLKESLTVYEDVFWVREAQAREKTFVRSRALSHKKVWA